MSLSSPLTAAQFIDLCKVAQIYLEFTPQRELSSQASGGVFEKDMGPALRMATIQSVPLTDDELADVLSALEWLQSRIGTFKVYDTKRRYPKSDPTGATLGSSSTVISSQITLGNVSISGLPAGYVLNRGDLFDVLAAQTSNYAPYSQDYTNAAWTKNHCTVGGTSFQAPDGTLTATHLGEDNTNNSHYINAQAIASLPASSNFVFSIFAAASERAWIALNFIDKSPSGHLAYFHLTGSGTVGTTVGSPSAIITPYPNAMYRCSVQASTGTGASEPQFQVFIASADNTSSYTGTTSSGVYLWGAQIRNNTPDPGRYVQTTSAIGAIGDTRGIHRLAESVTADGSGNATAVDISPPLRNVMGWRNVNFAVPLVTMCIVPGSVQIQPIDAKFSRLSFKAVENIPAP